MTETSKDEEEYDDNVRPKGNTANCYRSHFRMKILELTDEKYDISNKRDFPKFNLFWGGYVKELKAAGRKD